MLKTLSKGYLTITEKSKMIAALYENIISTIKQLQYSHNKNCKKRANEMKIFFKNLERCQQYISSQSSDLSSKQGRKSEIADRRCRALWV